MGLSGRRQSLVLLILLLTAGFVTIAWARPSQAVEASRSRTEPSGMTVRLPLSMSSLARLYEDVHQAVSKQRAGSAEWIPLGGGTGFLKYRIWPGSHQVSFSGAQVRSQALLPFGVEYAKRINGSVTRLATCGLDSPAAGTGHLAVTMETRFSYGRTYQLVPATSLTAVEPKGSCVLQDPTVDATPLMAQVYRSGLQQSLPGADRRTQQAIELKSAVADVWRDLQEPLLLDEAAALWLLVQPEAVKPGTVQSHENSLAAGFRISAHPVVVRGRRPAAGLRPLPELSAAPAPDGFRVTFDALVPLEEASQRLRDAVVGQEWSLGVGMVRIADAKLYPDGERAAVELVLRGLLPLTVVLKGRPEYDEAAGKIMFKQFDYQIKERNGVVNFAEVYLHDTLRSLLGQQVVVPVKDELDAMRQIVEKGLNRPLKGGTLRGTVDQLRLTHLVFQPKGLAASFKVEGELQYNVSTGVPEPTPITP